MLKKNLRGLARRTVMQLAKWRLLSGRKASILLHRILLGRFPDLNPPKDLNEIIIFLSHYTDISDWPRLADKYAVREYVREKIGDHILVPLYQAADTPDDIDFDALPQSFVVKITDGFARNIIIRDKSQADISGIKKKLKKWMTEKHIGDEPHYLKIKRKIIVEQLLPGPMEGIAPVDYKFICVNGTPLYCLACSNRDMTTFRSQFTLYRLPGWEDTDGITPGWESKEGVSKPELLNEMMEYAGILSKGFPLVRIDLYQVEGKIYFGEITFTSCAGREMKIKQEMLTEIGQKVDLSKAHIITDKILSRK